MGGMGFNPERLLMMMMTHQTVLHLGGDFGNFKVMLRPAGCSKKSPKEIRGCQQRKTGGISGNFLAPPTKFFFFTLYKTKK